MRREGGGERAWGAVTGRTRGEEGGGEMRGVCVRVCLAVVRWRGSVEGVVRRRVVEKWAMIDAAKAHACSLAQSLADEMAMLGQVDVSVRTGAGRGRRQLERW